MNEPDAISDVSSDLYENVHIDLTGKETPKGKRKHPRNDEEEPLMFIKEDANESFSSSNYNRAPNVSRYSELLKTRRIKRNQ